MSKIRNKDSGGFMSDNQPPEPKSDLLLCGHSSCYNLNRWIWCSQCGSVRLTDKGPWQSPDYFFTRTSQPAAPATYTWGEVEKYAVGTRSHAAPSVGTTEGSLKEMAERCVDDIRADARPFHVDDVLVYLQRAYDLGFKAGKESNGNSK